MHPILFEVGSITIYSYGFFIAFGALAGLTYMAHQGKSNFGTSYDKSNSLFIYIVVSAYLGGKVFFFFENPSYYIHDLSKLFSGNGFVFLDHSSSPSLPCYGSLKEIRSQPCLCLILWQSLLVSFMALDELAALWPAVVTAPQLTVFSVLFIPIPFVRRSP